MPRYVWVEVVDDGRPMPKVHKPKFYVDQGVPEPLIDSLRRRRLKVMKSIEELPDNAPDDLVRRRAQEHQMVLLTKDHGFWDDREHPLKLTSGMVIVDTDDRMIEKVFNDYYDFINRFSQGEWEYTKAMFNQELWRVNRWGWPEERVFTIGADGKLYRRLLVD